MTGKQGV